MVVKKSGTRLVEELVGDERDLAGLVEELAESVGVDRKGEWE